MTKTILPMKTAYALEYIPRGGRKPRVEAVGEAVPVEVEVLPELAPAVLADKDDTPVYFVHDGVFYRHAFGTETTIDRFAAAMGPGVNEGLGVDPWFADQELRWEGVSPFVLEARARDAVNPREVLRDTRGHGLAQAQRRADKFAVFEGHVYRRAAALPSLCATIYEGQLFVHGCVDVAAATIQGVPLRAFRWGDAEGVEGFADRYGLDRTALRENVADVCSGYRWTDAGLAAEDTSAWWMLWSLDRITRNPEESQFKHGFVSENPSVVRKLMDLADIVRSDDLVLPSAAEAARKVEAALPLLGQLEGMVSPGRTVFRAMLRYLRTEYLAYGPRAELDGMSLDEAVIGGLGAAFR
jgi:hypothetical protein